jgi:hypothetical protein
MTPSTGRRRATWLVCATLGLAALVAALASLAGGQPAPAANRFRFAFLGDRHGDAQPQIYGRVWREIDLLHPDFVVNVGDSIPGGHSDQTLDKQWDEFNAIRKRYAQYRLYLTPGNHDIWSDASEAAFVRVSGAQLNFGFDYQDARFVILDTSRTAELTSAQLDFLERDLSANAARNPKFIVFHHPFWMGKLDASAENFRLHQIARKFGVTYVVSGHGHRFYRAVRDGVTYMEVGSSGGSMRGKLIRGEGFAQGSFYHFVWATVEGPKVSLTVKEIDGAGGRGRMFSADDWDENGPHFDIADPTLSAHPET